MTVPQMVAALVLLLLLAFGVLVLLPLAAS